jgi:hypothetical protein
MSVLALGALAFVGPARDGWGKQRDLLGLAPGARHRVVLVHGAVELSLFTAAVVVAAALVTVPSGLVGHLGFFPLLRGLGALTTARFVPSPTDLPRPASDAALSNRAIAQVAGQGALDRFALLLPVLALATGAEIVTLAAAFAAMNVVVALLAMRASAARERARDDRVLPWLQVGLGVAVLLVSGVFNWLLQPRG